MSRGVWRCVAALAASGTWCLAQTAQPSGRMATDAGVDFRFYNVYSDNPVAYQNNQTAETATDTQKGTYYDYCRLRTRPWGRMRVDDQYELYMRLGNEFRAYDNNKQLYPFPDELYIDNLYVDLDDLWRDRLSVRLGRQDLKYGAGRVIRDGTPGDISRSYYFDAAKAEVRLTEKSSVDLVGIWQRPEDPWTLGNEDVDLTKYQTREGGNDLTERAALAYYCNRERKEFPYELYYVYKDESRWLAANGARLPERRYHTAGVRLIPRFSEHWTAEAELAGQYGTIGDSGSVGERDIAGWMGYGGTTYTVTEWKWKPYVTAATLVLSGDDERFDDPNASGTDTGWNPVFGRGVWTSDIMSAAYANYRLSNLIYPHVETGLNFADGHSVSLQGGPQFVCERDNRNGDSFRGYLGVLRYLFPLVRESKKRRGAVRGVVKLEVLEAGDYYGEPDLAYYLRFEIHAQL
ncbi:MAG: hypothetical protein GX565_04260 [Lentisphaerae bacterium]|nr:hypothetical protein [Lentisphaerota bacterium]